jgi:glycosyltransferase involved in cell wall biosynthesis
MGRINAADTSNNGLLLRNLFGNWPREKLAQIYSSGDTGDAGFFGSYYKLGPHDRRLGCLFNRLKKDALDAEDSKNKGVDSTASNNRKSVATWVKKWFVDTGLYELVFFPRISSQMRSWINEFRPDVVFAQGYSLAFTWLPLSISEHFGVPICYYPTDDWPNDIYRFSKNIPRLLSWPARRAVVYSSRQLVRQSAIRVAFNPAMQAAYSARYQVPFDILMHGDHATRFAKSPPKRLMDIRKYWIVSTGVFDWHRWPLLRDLDQACDILASIGHPVRATIFPVNWPTKDAVRQAQFRHIEFSPCPNHEEMAAILRGADLLFLPERFDDTVEDIKLCVSTKAHLFMFSGKPIVVYSAFETGIAQYAQQEQWAVLVDQRNPEILSRAIQDIAENNAIRQTLLANAQRIAELNHNLSVIQARFQEMLNKRIGQPAKAL